jgi:hypothetical protein
VLMAVWRRKLAVHWLALSCVAACSDRAVEQPRAALAEFLHFEAPSLSTLAGEVDKPDTDAPEQNDGSRDRVVPYVCERFELHVDEEGRVWHERLRHVWSEADREKFRALVELVADELDADPKLIKLWALRESTYNPYAIHVLDPDIEASIATWRRHHWDPERAAELEAQMDQLVARDPGYWAAKAELARISRFRNNPHYDTMFEYQRVESDGTRSVGRRSAWGYGYGPFGFNPTYFVPIWDPSAPPWVFCNEDGLAAIVTAIWSAREHQRECTRLGFGDSNEVVDRRFSSGHCAPRPGRDHKFLTRARARSLDPDARAQLGDRWPMDGSDREQLLDRLRARATDAGLLSIHASF